MIADATLLLFVIGILSSIKVDVKVDKIWSLLTFASVFFVFANFYTQLPNLHEEILSFVWNSSPSGDITVNVVSNLYNCKVILPFFIMTLLAMGNNLVFRSEERSSAFDAVLLFNLSALMLMITSNNFVQFLCGVFVVDILALFIVKDTDYVRAYVGLNIFADMILFMIMALVNSQVDSLDFGQILQYHRIGRHLNFIAVMGLIVVFIKLGFVPFQTVMLSFKEARFHRLQNVMMLTSPAVALILVMKFHALWAASVYFEALLNAGAWITLIWGIGGFILVDNYRAKMVYLQMMLAAYALQTLKSYGFEWSDYQSVVWVGEYLLLNLFYFLYYLANRKKLLSQYAEGVVISKLSAVALLLVGAGDLAAIIFNARMGENMRLTNFYPVFAGLICGGMILLIKQIKPVAKQTSKTTLMGVFAKTFWGLMNVTALMWLLQNTELFWEENLVFVLSGAAVLILLPMEWLNKVYASECLQTADIWQKIYHVLVREPLLFGGRFLWLLVDWVLVEKFVIGAVTGGLQLLIRLFRKLHTDKFCGLLYIVIFLAAILLFSFYGERRI